MKIACLTHYYIEENRAGGELMLHGLLSRLAADGHEVTAYITDTKRPTTTIDGVKVVYHADGRTILKNIDYDAVVTQFANSNHAIIDAKRRNKRIIYVAHNDAPQTYRHIRALAPKDLVVFNTLWLSKKLVGGRAKRVVVHPPIDRKSFETVSTGEYVSLVNLTPEKGADIFYSLAEQMPDVKFLGVEGGYYKHRQMMNKLDNVTLIKMTPNMRDDVYAKSKVVLMPSTYESFGMVAAEAIASGIPVIATPTSGLLENLGEAGVFVRRGVNENYTWRRALQKLLDDPIYYKQVSALSLKQSKKINTKQELDIFADTVKKMSK